QLIAKVFQRFLVFVQPKVRQPGIEVYFRILGVLMQRLLEGLNGLGKFQFGLVDNAEPFENFRLIRKREQGLLINLLSSCVILTFFEFARLAQESLEGLSLSPRYKGNGKKQNQD